MWLNVCIWSDLRLTLFCLLFWLFSFSSLLCFFVIYLHRMVRCVHKYGTHAYISTYIVHPTSADTFSENPDRAIHASIEHNKIHFMIVSGWWKKRNTETNSAAIQNTMCTRWVKPNKLNFIDTTQACAYTHNNTKADWSETEMSREKTA